MSIQASSQPANPSANDCSILPFELKGMQSLESFLETPSTWGAWRSSPWDFAT